MACVATSLNFNTLNLESSESLAETLKTSETSEVSENSDSLINGLRQLNVIPLEERKYIPLKNIQAYTTTALAKIVGGDLNLKEVFYQLPITETTFISKPGKKIKIDVIGNTGSILAAKCKVDGVLKVRGIDKGTRAFNNCISIVITVCDINGAPEKNIDFKLFKDNIQTTGSRTIEHTLNAWECIKSYLLLMTNISNQPLENLSLSNIRLQMVDKSFNLNFPINRESLKEHLDLQYGFHVIWECGVHSNGVSVKFPLEEFEGSLTKKKKKMPSCVSLIVFATGKVIISGASPAIMEEVYDVFHYAIHSIRDKIELKITKRT